MSLYNVLRTSTSGMEAQSFKLATIGENVANTSTVGYKRVSTEFSSLILDTAPSSYSSGAVQADIRHHISEQGTLSFTNSSTDIAIQGEGFFAVQDRQGDDYLTRSGSFVVDGESGNLVNAGGFALLGYPSVDGQDVAITLNDTGGLEPISLNYMNMRATPSTAGEITVNLDSRETALAGDLPSDNIATSEFTTKTSVIAWDDLGAQVTLDIYWTKVTDYDPGGPTNPQWEVSVFDASTEDTAVDNSFPYTNPNPPIGGATPANPILAQATLTFDQASGQISEITQVVAADGTTYSGVVDSADPGMQAELSIALPNSTDPLTINITETTQLAAEFTPLDVQVNGNDANVVSDVKVDDEGRVFAVYKDGTEVEFYRLPIARVVSPDQMSAIAGNVYKWNNESGGLQITLPGEAGNGDLIVSAVEQSNVELSSELTDMIISQRAYTANSKTFMTANEMLDTLVNLKR